MKAAVLFSGGKDSTLALYEVLKKGWEVKYLVTIEPESRESYMFHHPNVGFTKMQAESMGIPIMTGKTPGLKEKELSDLERVLKKIKNNIECLVSGAIASNYQKSRVDMICKKLGLESVAPLWQMDPEELWKSAIERGFEIIITAVACDGLEKDWLGKKIDEKNFEKLKSLSKKYRFHLGGEGGEFETFVLNGPIFKKPLKIVKSRTEWDNKTKSGYLVFEKILYN